MGESKDVLIEDSVKIKKEQRVGPARTFLETGELRAELGHRVDQEIPSRVMPRIVFCSSLSRRRLLERIAHLARSIQNLVNQQALLNRLIAALRPIGSQQFLFRIFRQT